MKNHKDYMKWLKENDPILYSELTSNPTGTDGGDFSGCLGLFIIGIVVLVEVIISQI